MSRALWHESAGHCRLPAPVVLSALDMLEHRLDRGEWPTTPSDFAAEANPPPMLRPCIRGGSCR
jgi:hypothetical protein